MFLRAGRCGSDKGSVDCVRALGRGTRPWPPDPERGCGYSRGRLESSAVIQELGHGDRAGHRTVRDWASLVLAHCPWLHTVAQVQDDGSSRPSLPVLCTSFPTAPLAPVPRDFCSESEPWP